MQVIQKETILLVEDEEAVRLLLAEILQLNNYHVLEASNGLEGVQICQTHQGPIDLIVTDIVMPQMNGRVMVEQAQFFRPTIKVLYMSGYTNDMVMRYGFANNNFAFIQKPFLPSAFVLQVRNVLNALIPLAA